MKYNVEVLEKMITNYTDNIKMFQSSIGSGDIFVDTEDRIAEMVGNRRLIAAMIDNDGEKVAPSDFRNGDVFFDSMLYQACAGADTSWW
jgi:hypothetical protein